MYVDYKVTVWKRVHFNENTSPKEVIQVLEEEGLDYVFDDELGFVEQEILYDTEEEMTPKENEGYPTIEVYVEGKFVDNLIWSNEKD